VALLLSAGRHQLIFNIAVEREQSSSTSSSPSSHSSSSATIAAGQQGNDGLVPKKENDKVGWMDLPNKDQLFILSLCRLSEPLSNVCLLPYIFYLVKSILPPPPTVAGRDNTSSTEAATSARVSEYSGLLVAAFPLAQFAVSLPWGRISDSYGRKTSIVVGLLISVISNAAFGFCRDFGSLLFWRTLAGLANGNVSIMRTMTAEIVKERKYQTRAFLVLPLVFNSGMVLSLALGGCLAEPVENLPWLFGPRGILNLANGEKGVQWAIDYPFALPALMNALFLAIALASAVLGLRETLPGREDLPDLGVRIGRRLARMFKFLWPKSDEHGKYVMVDEQDETALDLEAIASPSKEARDPAVTAPARAGPLPFRRIWTKEVIAAMVSFALLPLHNAAFMHIFPVYLSTPHVDNSHATLLAFAGGLGLKSSTIGLWLSAFGICGILLQMLVYPRLQARLGTLGVFLIALVMFPIVYAFAPYLSLLPPDGPLRWLGLSIIICAQIIARTIAIPSTVILLTEAAPEKSVLGTVHGAGNMLSSLSRAIGPAVGGWVFAWGVHTGIVGAVWWLYLVCVSIIALLWCLGIQRARGKAN
jgi:MFS family permease